MIEFNDKIYKYQLCAVISILSVFNLYQLIVSEVLLSIISLFFQVLIMIFIISKNQYTRITIKIWAALLFISGAAGLIQILASWGLAALDEGPMSGVLTPLNILMKFVFLTYGTYVFWGAKTVVPTSQLEGPNNV